ncbi:MAG: 4Fe-4S binding protein [Candidatus Aminicenantales bacterium]
MGKKKTDGSDEVYQRLAKRLDDMPGGFPATESGVELRILRRLFTLEEAELALKLNLLPEEPARIARRLRLSEEDAAQKLEAMALKGLLYRFSSKDGPPKYVFWQFVIGIWEFHVNSLDRDLIRDMEEYIPRLLDVETWKKVPQLRTIPIGQSIPVEHAVMPYEAAEQIVRSQERILIAPCICRRERKMVGEGCGRLEEACLVFGGGTDFYLKNGLGRLISQEEALHVLAEADREGLVLQPGNAQKTGNICCCCGCCCGVLRTLKKYPQPADIVSSAFRVSVHRDSCEGCGVCLDRCQMDALRLEDDKVTVDLGRCIGCGLCVTTCPTGSLTLERKPSSEQPEVPETMMKTYLKLASQRGKLKAGRVLGSWLRTRLPTRPQRPA